MKRTFLTAVLFFLISGATLAANTYTYIDLVNKLIDLEGLAVLPARGENADQWSSYDRKSYYDAEKQKYMDWAANGDGSGIIRREGNLSVIAEMEGPGVIWRIWSASLGDGHVKIYLDGSPEPAVDLPFKAYFDLRNEPFVYPALVYNASSGWDSFMPITYQKSCKIVAEDGWGQYYHFTYETFPEGTVVPTFRRDLSAAEKAALERVNDFLENKLSTDPAVERSGALVVKETIEAPAGKKVTVLKLEGARAITGIRVKPALEKTSGVEKLLRSLTLSIKWDGEAASSVWSPLGDFFGTAPGFNKYKSLPLGMTDEFFYSYWYMPFASEALIELENDGKTDAAVEFEIAHAPLSRPIDELGRFHAKWHGDVFLPKEKERRAIDWTLLTTEGRGRFVGVMLHVMNPEGGWWGEGDEKFFVDGEKFPSVFGTGSEDYFGYAWGDPRLFKRAYHNQTHNTKINQGHVSVNRWHIVDNVPFQVSFEGAIEKYFSNYRPTDYFATVYWYLSADGKDRYEARPLRERLKNLSMKIRAKKVKGALEGEELKIVETGGGETQAQNLLGFGTGWSGDQQLWWTGAHPGDKLSIAVSVEKEGRYEIKLQLTKAPDYGIVQFYLDDNKVGLPFDLYESSVVPSGMVSLGLFDLDAGEHTLTIEIAGANAKAAPAYMFGLDCVLLKAVK
ncbi:MAG: glycoside hydrolase family 172 protein [bacterium]